MILQVHDELVFDVFQPEAETLKEIVKSVDFLPCGFFCLTKVFILEVIKHQGSSFGCLCIMPVGHVNIDGFNQLQFRSFNNKTTPFFTHHTMNA